MGYMLHLSTVLLHYKQEWVQQAILQNARNRELGVRYGSGGFGKRPNMLSFPGDVLALAQKGASSFHLSEEHWANPLQLSTEMSRKDLDELRIGWDLVIDVDFEEWNATRIITHELIQALRRHNVKSISCKFSGNKGFHLGVPYAAFPENIHGKETRLWFPEGPKRVLEYLAHVIDSPENGFAITKRLAKQGNEKILIQRVCEKCGTSHRQKEESVEFICPSPSCGKRETASADTRYLLCPKCSTIMTKTPGTGQQHCSSCGSKKFIEKLNLKIDAMLISSRHLYRSVYSLHEKSGLVSIPVDPDRVLEFDREMAQPKGLRQGELVFLDSSNADAGEAGTLLTEAFDFRPQAAEEEKTGRPAEFEAIGERVPVEFFPPCMRQILEGVQDGRKRSLFILIKFLQNAGWELKEMDKLLHDWNARNPEPLREVSLKGQLRYHSQGRARTLPPNCDNMGYYRDFGVCHPDALCRMIKNPVQYVRRKLRAQPKKKAKKKTKKSDAAPPEK